MRSLIPFDGLFGDTVLDHFFDDVPTIYKDYVSVPKADIEDLKDHYEVTCDMPGYTKDEIQVTYENGILSLSAKREDTKETKDADRKFIRRERSSAGLQRQFAVSGVKEEGIKASLKDGVLKVELPKSGKPEIEPSHKIQID